MVPAPPDLILWPATWVATLLGRVAPQLAANVGGAVARAAGESSVARAKGWAVAVAGWVLLFALPLLLVVWFAAPLLARGSR